MTPIQTLHDHLDSGGILTGLVPVFFRWYDENTQRGASDSVLFRPAGGGIANELGQQPDITIAVSMSTPGAAYEKASAIRDYLIENYTIEGVANFQILADVTGPYELASQRNICEINVRMWI